VQNPILSPLSDYIEITPTAAIQTEAYG